MCTGGWSLTATLDEWSVLESGLVGEALKPSQLMDEELIKDLLNLPYMCPP